MNTKLIINMGYIMAICYVHGSAR